MPLPTSNAKTRRKRTTTTSIGLFRMCCFGAFCFIIGVTFGRNEQYLLSELQLLEQKVNADHDTISSSIPIQEDFLFVKNKKMKNDEVSTSTMSSSSRLPSSSLSSLSINHDVFLNRVLWFIQNKNDMMNWGKGFETFWNDLEDQIIFPIQNKTRYDPAVRYQMKYRGSGKILCTLYHKFKNNPKSKYPPHIIMDGMDENWGALSAYIVNKTANWGTIDDWSKQRGCSHDEILQHLSRKEMLNIITVQHHYNINHPKAHSIPIGIHDHDEYLEEFLNRIRSGEVSYEKTCTNMKTTSSNANGQQKQRPTTRHQATWLNINFSDYASRPDVEKILSRVGGFGPNTYSMDRMMDDVFEEMYCSKFVASPPGMGLDCHRTWEALMLGRIPILEKQTLGMGGMKRIYDELPILWIDRWEDVTEELLQNSWKELSTKLEQYNFERLTKQYWLNFIKSMIPEDI